MGNFRHQSSRTTDRDRDRETERDRQRDERDREGQERLRNVRLVSMTGYGFLTFYDSSPINTTASVLG